MQDLPATPTVATQLLRKLTLNSPSLPSGPSPTSSVGSPATPTSRRSLRLSTISPSIQRDTFAGSSSPSPRGSFDATLNLNGASTPSPSASRFGTTGRRVSGSGGHARKMSSISYSTSSIESEESVPLAGIGGPSTPRSGTPNTSGPSVGASGGFRRGSEESEREGTLREVHEADEVELKDRLEGQTRAPGRIGERWTALAGESDAEQNANDLLSFIAKKERKVLELRTELTRHETELHTLKKKWQAIVSKTRGPTTGSLPRPVSPNPPHGSSEKLSLSTSSLFTRSSPLTAFNSISLPSPTPSHTSLKRSPGAPTALSLDPISPFESISLFDPLPVPHSTRSLTGSPSQTSVEMELVGESVQAAKAWMGGVLGKVLEAVGNLEGTTEGVVNGKLNSLQEEDEEEEEEGGRNGKDRTTTTAHHSSSTGSNSTSTSDEFWKPDSSSTLTSLDSSKSISLFATGALPSLSPSPSLTSFPPSSSPHKSLPPTPTSTSTHARRRSTFDSAWKGLSGLSKRVATTVATSETFKAAKNVAISGVDSFERRITDALVGPELVEGEGKGEGEEEERGLVGEEKAERSARERERSGEGRRNGNGNGNRDLLDDLESEREELGAKSLVLQASPGRQKKMAVQRNKTARSGEGDEAGKEEDDWGW